MTVPRKRTAPSRARWHRALFRRGPGTPHPSTTRPRRLCTAPKSRRALCTSRRERSLSCRRIARRRWAHHTRRQSPSTLREERTDRTIRNDRSPMPHSCRCRDEDRRLCRCSRESRTRWHPARRSSRTHPRAGHFHPRCTPSRLGLPRRLPRSPIPPPPLVAPAPTTLTHRLLPGRTRPRPMIPGPTWRPRKRSRTRQCSRPRARQEEECLS
jgi:hypothetical protein